MLPLCHLCFYIKALVIYVKLYLDCGEKMYLMIFLTHTHTGSILSLIFTFITACTALPALEDTFSAHSFGLSVFKLVVFSV